MPNQYIEFSNAESANVESVNADCQQIPNQQMLKVSEHRIRECRKPRTVFCHFFIFIIVVTIIIIIIYYLFLKVD
jgi:hypothetical protein